MDCKVCIDWGNRNTVVAFSVNDQATPSYVSEDGASTLPSTMFVTLDGDGSLLLHLTRPEDSDQNVGVLIGLKHLVGRQSPKDVQLIWHKALGQTGITLERPAERGGGVLISFQGATVSARTAAIHYWSYVAKLIVEQATVAPTRLCVTVPVAFSLPVLDEYRAILRRVFPGVREAQMTREPFAALLGHLESSKAQLDIDLDQCQQFLVIDIGHGTLDAALMEMKTARKKKGAGRVLNLKVRCSMGADDCAGMSHTLALQVLSATPARAHL
jgi:molecular chaperone DnaK (HSP70)